MILRILKAGPDEFFLFTSKFVSTVFPMNPGALELEQNGTVTRMTEKSSQKILQLVENNNYITTTEMAESLGISRRAVAKQIDKLKEAGKLKRVGPDKGGHWEVLGEN